MRAEVEANFADDPATPEPAMSGAVAWVRGRSAVEWVCLGAGLAVFGYVGWDGALWDARFQLGLHLIAIGAIAGLALVAVRGGDAAPYADRPARCRARARLRDRDRIGHEPRHEPARDRRHRRVRRDAVRRVDLHPVSAVMGRRRHRGAGAPPVGADARRACWPAGSIGSFAGAPGIPPIRLRGRGHAIRLGGRAAVRDLARVGARRTDRVAPMAAHRAVGPCGWSACPSPILSGSRSAWLAMGVTIVAAAIPWAWRRRHRLRPSGSPDARTIGLAILALVGLAAAIVLVAPRLTAVTSLIYRASLWRDTLAAWSTDPLLGIGPGYMPYARQAAAPDFTFPVRQPHSHNLPLGVLGDAGLLGLAAAIVLVACIAWFAGPWRSRTTTGRVAAYLLIGLAVGGLFEDLTFVPGFNLLAIALLAVALTDSGVVEWRPMRRRAMLVPAGRRRARAPGRDGRRRCRSDRIPRRAATPPPGATGRRASRCSSGRSRSIRGTRQGRSRWRSPPSAPAATTSGATRPSPPSSPGTTPATRRRGSTSPSSARSRATPTARLARPSERSPRPASSRPSSSTRPSATRRSGWPMRPMTHTSGAC